MNHLESIATITIAVPDQEAALSWFTEVLGFEKRADDQVVGVRWLTVGPKGGHGPQISLATWFPDRVGTNAPIVFGTSDCQAAYADLQSRGVVFDKAPDDQPYGIVSVFRDPYGNQYVILQQK